MVVSKKESLVITIFAEQIRLEQVKEFKYLGSWITENGDCLTEIKRRIGVAKSFFWKHKESLKHNISMKLKKMILNTYIFSVVSYGCESWTYNSAIVKQLNSSEMSCYRRILKIKWTDMVSNKDVLSRVGLVGPCLTKDLFKRKMEFAGHVLRGSSGTIHNEIIEGYIHGKRDKGRQRRTWVEDLKDWRGIENFGALKRTAEDRKK